MFDNHHAPSIPARGTPPAKLPPRLARICTMAGLLSLPLMLAASFGNAALWTVLLLGMAQTALVAIAAILLAGPAETPLARVMPAAHPQRFTHG
jgi:hypothetical protein